MKTTQLIKSVILAFFIFTGVQAEQSAERNCMGPCPDGGLVALREAAIYPTFAQESKLEGIVIVNFVVDENGNVSNIEIVKSAGDLLDESAIKAIVSTEWHPAKQNGKAISAKLNIPFEFRLT